jgi:hypothetical protein
MGVFSILPEKDRGKRLERARACACGAARGKTVALSTGPLACSVGSEDHNERVFLPHNTVNLAEDIRSTWRKLCSDDVMKALKSSTLTVGVPVPEARDMN